MATMKKILINCDMGEGLNNDAQLMPMVDLANIACGGHAGNEHTIRETIQLAARNGARVGAHISFADRAGFGRVEQAISHRDLYMLVRMQLVLFMKIARDERATVFHVKPHGALYNLAARDAGVARTIAEAIKYVDKDLVVLALSGSVAVQETINAGLSVLQEVFADRRYNADGSLVNRALPGAVLESEGDIREQVTGMVNRNEVIAQSGEHISLPADTICVHGDNAHAVHVATIVHAIVTK